MIRFAMNNLLQWKEKKKRKPLIIMGARQVGKTWLMKEFGKNCYEKTAYISFYNNQRMDAVFENDFDIERIIMNLNIESGVTITPENTLIILDEIQNTQKVLESLKYFCEEAPEYHIVPSKIVADTIRKNHEKWLNTPGKKGQKHNNTNIREFYDLEKLWFSGKKLEY